MLTSAAMPRVRPAVLQFGPLALHFHVAALCLRAATVRVGPEEAATWARGALFLAGGAPFSAGEANFYAAYPAQSADCVDETEATIARLETELAHARNQRVDRRFDLWQIVKQVRLAARVFYGEQSSEYELFGGTRLSEQKSKGASRSPEPAQA